jgi:hypothetical protein
MARGLDSLIVFVDMTVSKISWDCSHDALTSFIPRITSLGISWLVARSRRTIAEVVNGMTLCHIVDGILWSFIPPQSSFVK